MNRTLLILVCDFLLISMLAIIEVTPPSPAAEELAEQAAQTRASDADTLATLQSSLEGERRERGELLRQQAELADNLQKTAEQSAAELAAAAARQRELELARAQLSSRLSETEQAAAAAQEAAAAAAARQRERELAASAAEAALAEVRRQLQGREAELQSTRAETDRLRQRERELELAREEAQGQLRVREAERQLLEENLRTAQTRLEAERAERAELAATTSAAVTAQAERVSALQEEVRQNQPLNANEVFARARASRAQLTLGLTPVATASRARKIELTGVFVRDGLSLYAVFLGRGTPWDIEGGPPPTGTRVSLEIVAGTHPTPFRPDEVLFLEDDPRVLAVRVPSDWHLSTGTEAFPLADNPLRWPEAVALRADGSSYGEVPFTLATAPSYLRLDRRLVRRLVGEYAPARGDLVFSRSGAWLGLAVNADTCVLVRRMTFTGAIAPTVFVAPALPPAATGILNAASQRLATLPEDVR